MTQNCVLLTGQYLGDAAIYLGVEGVHYNAWRDDFDALMSIAKLCSMRDAVGKDDDLMLFQESPSRAALNNFYGRLALSGLNEADFQKVVAIAKGEHHYQ